MKIVKNYEKFSEEYRLNENFLKNAWDKVIKFFRDKFGKYAWAWYAAFLIKTGKLPKKKVEIYIPKSLRKELDINLPDDISLEVESIDWENVYLTDTLNETINESVVELEVPPGSEIRNVDVEILKDKIRTVYEMNAYRVKQGKKRNKTHALFIWGAPGIGKTDILNEVANDLDIWVQEWHLSQIEPTDFRGIPKIVNVEDDDDPSHERTVTRLPALFPTSDTIKPGSYKEKNYKKNIDVTVNVNDDVEHKGKGGIMFFDEINRAPKMVLSAALSLCLGGRIGDYELPDHWIVIAAGNRAEDLGSYSPTVIEPALANRFQHVNFAPKMESWFNWAAKRDYINPDLLGFFKFAPDYFHKLDPEKEPKAWPSPRSWDQASEEEFHLRRHDWSNPLSKKQVTDLYTDYVGMDAAIKYAGYLDLKKYFDENDVENVFKKGKGAKQIPKDLSQSYAASASIAGYKKNKELTEKELTNFLEYSLNLPDLETRTPLLSAFIHQHPECKEKEPWKKIWWTWIRQWHKELKGLDNEEWFKNNK